jgi:phosphoglycolate phosphatase
VSERAAGKYSLVIFDFDGTLVDSARCITTSLERALTTRGCACDVTHVREQIGLPLESIIRQASAGIADEAIEPVIAAYRTEYAALEGELIVPFPGAVEIIDALHRDGVGLAIATNKLTDRARMTLERFGIATRFAAIVGADRVAHPKPYPDIVLHVLAATGCRPDMALMVGDTEWDVEMARRAGVNACAVTWGNHSAARLARAQPLHVTSSFTELRKILQTIES